MADQFLKLNADNLDDALLLAHESNDHSMLVELYSQAGQAANGSGDLEAACFYYTHAMVFALEKGDPKASSIREFLVKYGREEPI